MLVHTCIYLNLSIVIAWNYISQLPSAKLNSKANAEISTCIDTAMSCHSGWNIKCVSIQNLYTGPIAI